METAFIGLGSNLGCRKKNLRTAIAILGEQGGFSVLELSPLYETQPVGIQSQPWFLNAVLKGQTTLRPKELLARCKEVEKKLGRKSTPRSCPRLIDLDLLLFGGCVIDSEGLVIPHPKLATRAFVLEPLAELDEDLLHPQLNVTIGELLDDLEDEKKVIQLARKEY